MIKRNAKHYTSNFMTRKHHPITHLNQIKRYTFDDMFLFYRGNYIGQASIEVVSKNKKHYHTEGMTLDRKYRKKGHGIHLYLHLISRAKRLGVVRLYSSETLNQHSRRMWDEKLPKYFDVKRVYAHGPCSTCGVTGTRVKRFYIDLNPEV